MTRVEYVLYFLFFATVSQACLRYGIEHALIASFSCIFISKNDISKNLEPKREIVDKRIVCECVKNVTLRYMSLDVTVWFAYAKCTRGMIYGRKP